MIALQRAYSEQHTLRRPAKHDPPSAPLPSNGVKRKTVGQFQKLDSVEILRYVIKGETRGQEIDRSRESTLRVWRGGMKSSCVRRALVLLLLRAHVAAFSGPSPG